MNKLYIIGITGSYGKTSCAYTLHSYFKYLGYESCLMSSTKLDFPSIKNINWSNQLKQEKSADYYVYQARGADFLIIEIHEESLKKGLYNNVEFDCKVLVNFEEGFNIHREQKQYGQLKKDFFNTGSCIRVINKNIENFKDFNTKDAIIFSTKEHDECFVYPLSNNLKFKKSAYTMMVGAEKVELKSYLNKNGYQNILTSAAILYALNMYDKDSFIDDFLSNNFMTPGRYELKTYSKNRNVVIDSGNARSLINFVKETEDLENYNVKSLISVAGGITDTLYQDLISDGFVSLNKYLIDDPVVRYHCLIFGGNMYNGYHKLAMFPDKFVYNEVLEEVGKDKFLDLSNNTLQFPENLAQEMINITIMLGTDDLTCNPKYCQNFWWRSIPVFKGYFTINYDKFLVIYNTLKQLNNKQLTESCEYVKEMIDYTRSQYSKLGESLKDINISRIYLTMNNSNEYSNMLELEMYKVFFKQDVSIYSDRRDALTAMAKDSSENDVLYIAGRGDRNAYKLNNSSYVEFTDSQYIEELLNKEDIDG